MGESASAVPAGEAGGLRHGRLLRQGPDLEGTVRGLSCCVFLYVACDALVPSYAGKGYLVVRHDVWT